MQRKRSAYQNARVATQVTTQADQIESLLHTWGIDPASQIAWPIWDAWVEHGMAGALEHLRELEGTGMPEQAAQRHSCAHYGS